MPNNLFQDMVRIKREREEEARLNSLHKKVVPHHEHKVLASPVIPQKVEEEKVENRYEVGKRKGGNRKALWLVAVISAGFFFFALSFLFSEAEVTINPKIKDLKLNENLSAVKNTNDDLSFDVIVISDEENKTVTGGEMKQVAVSATGTVIIYNNFSANTQKLDIDTRLEGSNGKMYKTKKAVTVPGIKNGTAGSVEVDIYAAEAGESYNSVPLDFKIFGFKGTPKYSKFYARSKSSISGGMKGMFPSLSDKDKASMAAELKTSLTKKLLDKANGQIPQGFVLFNDAVVVNIDGEKYGDPQGNNFPVTYTGTLYGILFSEEKLAKKIAKLNVDGYDGSSVYISNLKDLDFSLYTKLDPVEFNNLKNISFNLSGAGKLVSRIDEDKLRIDLLGKKKSDFNQILSQYPAIDSAQSVVSPFWRRSFPDKEKNIALIVNYPK